MEMRVEYKDNTRNLAWSTDDRKTINMFLQSLIDKDILLSKRIKKVVITTEEE